MEIQSKCKLFMQKQPGLCAKNVSPLIDSAVNMKALRATGLECLNSLPS